MFFMVLAFSGDFTIISYISFYFLRYVYTMYTMSIITKYILSSNII